MSPCSAGERRAKKGTATGTVSAPAGPAQHQDNCEAVARAAWTASLRTAGCYHTGMVYVSDDLVHFVGFRDPADDAANWRVLEAIVASGEILAGGEHPAGAVVLERNLGEPLSTNRRYLPSMACFADIPENELAIHVAKYGPFGLALPKQYLIPQGVRPVTYVPYGAGAGVMAQRPDIEEEWDEVSRLLESRVISLFGGTTGAPPGSREASRIDEFIEFGVLAYIKFFDPSLPPNNPANFYMEREWRSHAGVEFAEADVQRLYVARGWAETAGSRFPSLGEAGWVSRRPGLVGSSLH